jgi:hypothetical protein
MGGSIWIILKKYGLSTFKINPELTIHTPFGHYYALKFG